MGCKFLFFFFGSEPQMGYNSDRPFRLCIVRRPLIQMWTITTMDGGINIISLWSNLTSFNIAAGTQYVSGKEIEKLNNCAAALLMGCSSGTLHCKGSYAPRGAPLSYLFAGSPAIVANLWDVSDKDIDRFSKALLNSWLQENFTDDNSCSKCSLLIKEFESMNIASKDNGRARRKGTRGRKPQQIKDITKCCSCRQKRIASYLSEARRACRLPFLIGASPVCYGVPTIIRKKVMTDSVIGEERRPKVWQYRAWFSP